MIAVDAATNACLGLVGGDVWTRPGLITTRHRDRPLSERESRRWPETAEQAKDVLASAAMLAPAEALTWSYISGTTCESADSSTRCPYLFWNGMALHGRGIAWAVRR
jgi:hypothetical protein